MSAKSNVDNTNPMACHESIETYFTILKSDPYGLKNKAFNWKGEDKFVAAVLPLIFITIGIVLYGQHNLGWDKVSPYTYALFAAWILIELIGKVIFSYIVLNWNIKINYTRKLGLRPWRKLKSYVLPLVLVGWFGLSKDKSSAIASVTMLQCLDILKTIGTEWNRIRRKSKFLSYAFVSWDRVEDRPYTMRYDIMEDILRFMVYLPFIYFFGKEAILVMIPNLINEFGDGLAEPVGIKFGRLKYKVKSLWYNGKFWHGNFQRTIEGSLVVFTVSIIIIFMYKSHFTPMQLYVLFATLPIGMSLAEAVSPHTNDGPMLALVGCTIIWAVLHFV